MVITLIILVIFYVICNIYVAKTMTIMDMCEDFFEDQYLIGKIFANLFYLPVWIYKLTKA